MTQSLKDIVLAAVALFALASVFLLVQHEIRSVYHVGGNGNEGSKHAGGAGLREFFLKKTGMADRPFVTNTNAVLNRTGKGIIDKKGILLADHKPEEIIHEINEKELEYAREKETAKEEVGEKEEEIEEKELELTEHDQKEEEQQYPKEQKGLLMCNGSRVDSEIIYWKVVPGDRTYESPITPHHADHHDKYLTFEYDQSGWNNMRMAMEILLMVAHATGRTIVAPPPQHLYLLSVKHKHHGESNYHFKTGFEDFYDLELLKSQQGLHIMHMEEFLRKEGVSGQLKGRLPPENSTQAWGTKLWAYMKEVADILPNWENRIIPFPTQPVDFEFTSNTTKNDASLQQRLTSFAKKRTYVYYNHTLQQARHVHFPAGTGYRLVEHFHAFAFFADPFMQTFYKRFVRDFMRYKDEIQCAGHRLVQAVRDEARAVAPHFHGDYYALHIRRGDFQYKNVKIGAQEIVDNLHYPNGTAMIPVGAMVYISTDDPDGLCKGCLVNRKPCESYATPKPPGCPEDTSWKAFIKAGWKIRFLRDFERKDVLSDVNPNTIGMVESIVCSRATLFAGTYFSTFTGYIHRLRGYHGRGNSSFYQTKRHVRAIQDNQLPGYGCSREWKDCWLDENGQLI